MLLAPLYIWLIWPAAGLIAAQVLITVLLFWRHRSNIEKLLSGSEDQIGN